MYPTDGERLRHDLRNVVEDVEHILENTAQATGEHAEALRSQARERLHRIRTRLGEMEREAAGRMHIVSVCTNDYVRQRPWRVIGGAAAFAFVLGMLARPRR